MGPAYVEPLDNGFFFRNVTRFKAPIPFRWPAGPVKPINVPLLLVAGELKRVGIDPEGIL